MVDIDPFARKRGSVVTKPSNFKPNQRKSTVSKRSRIMSVAAPSRVSRACKFFNTCHAKNISNFI